MEVSELDTFIVKFKQLWYSGHSAHLDIDTHAGHAWVGLRVRLGQAPGPLHHQPPKKTRDGPSRQRRRTRRAEERKKKAEEAVEIAEAVQAHHEHAVAEEAEHEHERAVTEEADNEHAAAEQAELQHVEAEQAKTEEVAIENAAVEATDFTCDLCDREYDSLRALRTHQGKKHKASSPIPQLDGGSENLGNTATYTFVSEFAIEDIEYTEGVIP